MYLIEVICFSFQVSFGHWPRAMFSTSIPRTSWPLRFGGDDRRPDHGFGETKGEGGVTTCTRALQRFDRQIGYSLAHEIEPRIRKIVNRRAGRQSERLCDELDVGGGARGIH
jgi:hypothetical protein